MRQLIAILAAFAVLLAPASAAKSGLYIAADEEKAHIIHLVETGAGQVSGQAEWIEVNKKGELETRSSTVSGSIADGHVVLTIGQFFGKTVTGQLRGNRLSLIFDGSGQDYMKSNAAGRQRLIDELERRGAEIRQVTLRKRQQENEDAAERAYQAFITAAHSLEQREEKTLLWIDDMASQYTARKKDIAERQHKIIRLQTTANSWDRRITLEDEIIALEDDIYALDDMVIARQQDLAQYTRVAREAMASAKAYCVDGNFTRTLAICADGPAREAQYQHSYDRLKSAFDDLARTRDEPL